MSVTRRNYRVVRFTNATGTCLQLREVSYAPDWTPDAVWEPVTSGYESVEELGRELRNMLKALERPLLERRDPNTDAVKARILQVTPRKKRGRPPASR